MWFLGNNIIMVMLYVSSKLKLDAFYTHQFQYLRNIAYYIYF